MATNKNYARGVGVGPLTLLLHYNCESRTKQAVACPLRTRAPGKSRLAPQLDKETFGLGLHTHLSILTDTIFERQSPSSYGLRMAGGCTKSLGVSSVILSAMEHIVFSKCSILVLLVLIFDCQLTEQTLLSHLALVGTRLITLIPIDSYWTVTTEATLNSRPKPSRNLIPLTVIVLLTGLAKHGRSALDSRRSAYRHCYASMCVPGD